MAGRVTALDAVKAIEMHGRGRKVAMCSCDAPLVSTLAFRHFEFYCLDCGRRYGFLDPRPADETPELIARCDAYLAEWSALSEGLISEGGRRSDCATCVDGEEHTLHATADERAAHEAALERLRARIVRSPG